MQAIRVHAYGPPEQLQLDDLPLPVPGPDEALVDVAFAGVNFYDTQLRSGLLKRPLPLSVGLEGAGTVVAAGTNVDLAPGTRVGWAQSGGSYATHAVVPAHRLAVVPAGVGLEQAAAVLFAGMTAHHLACSTYPLATGDWCVVHSAAGGVGLLLTQIAALRGAHVVGVVSTDAKAEAARRAGAAAIVIGGREDLAATVRALTAGRGADVVYDAVGLETFEASLDCLRPRGLMVSYGEASGFVPPLDIRDLSKRGSLFITRTSLSSYIASPAEYAERAGDLFGWIADGRLNAHVHATYPLAAAAEAHRALESRASVGKLLLACAERR